MDGGSIAVSRVCDVPAEHLSFIWPQARPLLVKAIERDGRCEPADVLALLLASKARLWVSWDGAAIEAAIVTEIIEFPKIRELRVWLVGGRNLRAWVYEARDMIEEFGRAHACTIISGGGRMGWLRFGGLGCKSHTMIEKRLAP